MLYTIFFSSFFCLSPLLFFFYLGEISLAFEHERNGLQSWVYIGLSKAGFQILQFKYSQLRMQGFAIMI
jgi:hypothetical protein